MPRQSVKFSLEFKEELETALRKKKKKKIQDSRLLFWIKVDFPLDVSGNFLISEDSTPCVFDHTKK